MAALASDRPVVNLASKVSMREARACCSSARTTWLSLMEASETKRRSSDLVCAAATLNTPRAACSALVSTKSIDCSIAGILPISCSIAGILPISCSIAGILPISCSIAGILPISCSIAGILPISCSIAGILPISCSIAGILPISCSIAGILPTSISRAGSLPRSSCSTGVSLELSMRPSISSRICCGSILVRASTEYQSDFPYVLTARMK